MEREILVLLEDYERQLRYLAAGFGHKTTKDGNPPCDGSPICTKCGLLSKADVVADVIWRNTPFLDAPPPELGSLL